MAQLEYKITGDNSGLVNATNAAIANIENLTDAVNAANVSLQFRNGVSALDTLGQKLLVVQGNSSLFGDSIKLQTQEVGAYQTALNSLLANGFEPMDGDVQRLKSRIDELTTSLQAVNSVKPRSVVSEIGDGPSAESLPTGATGSTAQQAEFITQLNSQLQQGVITLEEYNQALLSANSTASILGQTTQSTSEAIQEQDGFITGLRQQLAELNELRLTAPVEDLAVLNSEIQETEIALSQATNIGKVGFDQFGNSIRGVSLQNVNGQLIALSNNLFGARQIARDLARAFTSDSLAGTVKNLTLLAVDFLFYAQNAAFATGATVASTAAIATEGTVATTTAFSVEALGVAFKSLLTPLNLIVLGVAVAAGAFEAFENSQKKVSVALTQAEQDLKAFNAVQKDSATEFGKQVASLQQLYDATQNVTLSMERRLEAAQELRDIYPAEFQNTTNLAIVNGDLKNSYEALTDSILKNAVAQAAQKQIAEEELKIAVAREQLNKIAIARNVENTRTKGRPQDDQVEGGGILSGKELDDNNKRAKQAVQDQQDIITQARNTIKNILEPLALDFTATNQKLADANKLLGQNLENFNSLLAKSTDEQQFENIKDALQTKLNSLAPGDSQIASLRDKIKQVEEIIKNAYTVKLTKGSLTDPFQTISDAITNITNKINAKASDSGLSGYALAVQKIENIYTQINTDLDKQQQKLNALQKTALSPKQQNEKDVDQTQLDTARTTALKARNKELGDAKIAEATRVANEIQRINDEFNVKQTAGYNSELASVQKLYDAEVVKAKGNKEILTALRAAALVDVKAIDDKYIEQEKQIYDKLIDIANVAFEALDSGEAARTDKINLEWKKRITAASVYFDKLRDEAKAAKLPQSATDNINSIQSQVTNLLNAANFKQISEEISKNFAAAMQSAVQGFVSNFYASLTSLGNTRQSIDEKYNLQLQKQQDAFASGTSDITAAQNASTIAQINNLKKLELQATTSFGAIFSSLVSKFNSTFNESILNSFTKQFTENLGKTLLTPTAAQLKISPEEQAAQQTATILKSAGNTLAEQIKDAGITFYNEVTAKTAGVAINPGLLDGTSGGSSVGSLAGAAVGAATTAAGVTTGAAGLAAGTTLGAADTAAKTTTAAADHLSAKVAGAAAALSLAGGLVSGATSPTSKVGQGVGGLLQGAGEGALIGSAIPGVGTIAGAVVGGAIGLISGIFSASKAQKALQEQQLEQQQEQTALLKASLAYTSSIIGRDTANGIVTGITVGVTGQLVATISGKDLQFILNRNANVR